MPGHIRDWVGVVIRLSYSTKRVDTVSMSKSETLLSILDMFRNEPLFISVWLLYKTKNVGERYKCALGDTLLVFGMNSNEIMIIVI